MRRVKTAVLISGNGSNLQAIIDAAKAPDYPAKIAFVLSNKTDAYGLTRAANAGIETLTLNHKQYMSRSDFDAAMDNALRARNIELVVMAGFMRILSDEFVLRWQGRLINIHPSLLPKYKGMHTHQRVLDAGETQHGATVHWVIPELDAGEIIAQASLDILPNDTAESLQQRVHALEHQLYPKALAQIANQLNGRKPKNDYFVHFPAEQINSLLKLAIEHSKIRIHKQLWHKVAKKHPESMTVIEEYLDATLNQPEYVGQAPTHFYNIELVRRTPVGTLLAAIKIRDNRGFYCRPIIASAYLISGEKFRNRLKNHTLLRIK